GWDGGRGEEVQRRVGGGGDGGDAAGEERVEQAGGGHGVADVGEVELGEADEAGVADQRGDGVVDGGGGRGGGVQGGEEFVEMPAARAIGAGGGEEAVHEHGLASARRAVQVDAAGAPAGSATAIQECRQPVVGGALVGVQLRGGCHPPRAVGCRCHPAPSSTSVEPLQL